MRLMKLLVALLLLVGAAAFFGCEKQEDQPSADDWVERGKNLLGENDGSGAYLAFKEALDIQSGNLEARYGVVLADILQFVGTLNLLAEQLLAPVEALPAEEQNLLCQRLDQCNLIQYIAEDYAGCLEADDIPYDEPTRQCIIGAPDCKTVKDNCLALTIPPDAELCAQACEKMESCGFIADTEGSVGDCKTDCPTLYAAGELQCFMYKKDCAAGRADCFIFVGNDIQQILNQFWTAISDEMAYDLNAVQGHDDFLFEIKKYNFSFFNLLFQPSLSGIHDLADTYFFSAIYFGMDALLSGVQAYDLDINPLLIQSIDLDDLNLDLNLIDFGEDDLQSLIELLQWINELIGQILDDPIYSTFLTLNQENDEAADIVETTGQDVGMIFGSLATMIELVGEETDDQSDDAIRFVDLNGDSLWDDEEPLIIPGVLQAEYALAWALHDLCVALKVDFVEGYPFHFEELKPLLDYLDLPFLSAAIDLLDLMDVDSVDLGAYFRDPDPAGLRPLLADLQEFLTLAIELLSDVNLQGK